MKGVKGVGAAQVRAGYESVMATPLRTDKFLTDNDEAGDQDEDDDSAADSGGDDHAMSDGNDDVPQNFVEEEFPPDFPPR